ncbi:hypothetical protein C2S52_018124 [Perilla frutescens var. hirtella]|uniref:Uncharacterized protein n=1 Tax=Perilla frutescens var. hirtella TaxID=608512 RepID=A0AAD4IQX0_PERFH|nr:hypothetical protein C2S52_018124 [Perilla frutescens var. hirtella]KAH6811862.1 hypothetical protein C2S51_025624 [Perilla frutescens var. frutescens]KAH6819782.1 hypothetical protein C2S53_010165 [Perilla frutescens var. hirtella]
MGNCRSCESRSTVTAKLILVGGHLQEFSWPVKVSLLLQQDSDCFISSSEEMEFGECAVAMGGEEVLQPGEIYFELPPAWRNVRLQAEDMAALALKASVALASKCRDDDDDNRIIIRCCCCCLPRRRSEPAALFCEKEMPLLAGDGGDGVAKRGGAKGRKFVAKLSAIVED